MTVTAGNAHIQKGYPFVNRLDYLQGLLFKKEKACFSSSLHNAPSNPNLKSLMIIQKEIMFQTVFSLHKIFGEAFGKAKQKKKLL